MATQTTDAIRYTTAAKRHDEPGTRTLGTVGSTSFGELIRQVEIPAYVLADQLETYDNRGTLCMTQVEFDDAIGKGHAKAF